MFKMTSLSGQRRQTIHTLSIGSMQISSDKCMFSINSLLKTSRPGKHLAWIEFQAYVPDVRLCVVQHLQQYLTYTYTLLRDVKQLLIIYSKRYKAVSPDSLSRWIKTTLVLAGVDTSKYGAHSKRSASTSAAKRNSVSFAITMKIAGWSKESTSAKFYNKSVEPRVNFGAELLKAVCCDS